MVNNLLLNYNYLRTIYKNNTKNVGDWVETLYCGMVDAV